ncbi:beta-galactosidase [Occultella gossypii]|uniref:Beta-galactosidase n=1 Tax=Occultella gossypii TaxID=2800820 RepID=A0ABS7SBD4_9MICO|nr:beta-galactosidase [Occultella gossypii]MBZ2196989.1 beta-galactosidase [Occultella gossypii]
MSPYRIDARPARRHGRGAPVLPGGAGIEVYGSHLERDGVPWIPISGEFHFTRSPRATWAAELAKVRAAGLNTVATYLFWLHHERERGTPDFTGILDIRHFVTLAAEAGLDVLVRIGPWAHGEARNGGLPDWVQHGPWHIRTDDPGYLEQVRRWYAAIAGQLDGLDAASGGPIIGVQVENELADAPEHLVTLRGIAHEAGLRAPLWTMTAWNTAVLPTEGFLPLYGGYTESFWTDADEPWSAGCRSQFTYTHLFDDTSIGADVMPTARPDSTSTHRRFPTPDPYPVATCELGSGMATAYHRRPLVDPDDVAAVALTKLGSGSVWQGYYMFHGGLNPPVRGLQESHASGYPNDLPEFDYDFGAPIGAAGQVRPSLVLLRRQHRFLADFGPRLAPMASVLPTPDGEGGSAATLRWAVRTDGESGFVFVTNHQPHEPLPAHPQVALSIETESGTVAWPTVDVGVGAYFAWPFNLDESGVRIGWATAQPVARIVGDGSDGSVSLLFLRTPGIETRFALRLPPGASLTGALTDVDDDQAGGSGRDGDVVVAVGSEPVVVSTGNARIELRVFDAGDLDAFLDSEDPVGRVTSPVWMGRSTAGPGPMCDGGSLSGGSVHGRTPAGGSGADRADAGVADLSVRELAPSGVPPTSRSASNGRLSAPLDEDFAGAARFEVDVPSQEGLLRVEWTGDVLRARLGDRLLADQFFSGAAWEITAADLRERAGVPARAALSVTLEILPFPPDAAIWLDPRARAALAAERFRAGIRSAHWHRQPR